MTQFKQSFICQTGALTFDFRILCSQWLDHELIRLLKRSGPVAAKQAVMEGIQHLVLFIYLVIIK